MKIKKIVLLVAASTLSMGAFADGLFVMEDDQEVGALRDTFSWNEVDAPITVNLQGTITKTNSCEITLGGQNSVTLGFSHELNAVPIGEDKKYHLGQYDLVSECIYPSAINYSFDAGNTPSERENYFAAKMLKGKKIFDTSVEIRKDNLLDGQSFVGLVEQTGRYIVSPNSKLNMTKDGKALLGTKLTVPLSFYIEYQPYETYSHLIDSSVGFIEVDKTYTITAKYK